MKSLVVFGIDVSSRQSTVAVVINRAKLPEFKISNDLIGFKRLGKELELYHQPQIIFEATGVYSRRLQAFLERNNYDYIRMNPLTAKKLMDNNLRHNKTDRTDAVSLALIQFANPQKVSYVEPQVYQEMQANSRIYEQFSHDLVKYKNRLHRALQLTFPEIEQLMTPIGKNYWRIVQRYPHPQLVLRENETSIAAKLKLLSGIGPKRSHYLAQQLVNLAKQSCSAVSVDSAEIWGIRANLMALRFAYRQCQTAVKKLNQLSKQLPGKDLDIYTSIPGIAKTTALRLIAELGDLRRFDKPNQIDAFVGIDPSRYQSGKTDKHLGITKHGNAIARKILYRTIGQIESASKTNPCHIADYYNKRKKSSHSQGYKKIAIAAVHKLIRTAYALIKNNQLYDYSVANKNQRL